MHKVLMILSALLCVLLLPCVPAQAGNVYTLGVEGFHDNYQEPGTGVEVDSNANYGSVLAGYTHFTDDYFTTLQGRFSYGQNDYASVSGTADNIDQFEGELRLFTGFNLDLSYARLSPYAGLGLRGYKDAGKGFVTTLGFGAYDRRIAQLYLPVGASMSIHRGAWTLTPLLEYDQLLYGRVNSRLQNVGPDYFNINNNQRFGYGIRGEFMAGRQWGKTFWEVGPFVRYWNVDDSDITTAPDGTRWIEPDNNRTQVGAQLRIRFK